MFYLGKTDQVTNWIEEDWYPRMYEESESS